MAAVATAALTVGVAASPALGDGTAPPTPGVVSPSSTVQGQTYSQWSAAQWQWTLEQPNVADSPVVDPNPGTAGQPEAVDCTLGQLGTVWFLAGATFLQSYSTAYRSCSVPAGVYLFFPVIDVWADDLSCPGTPSGTLTGKKCGSWSSSRPTRLSPNP